MNKNILLFFLLILICSIANAQKSDSTIMRSRNVAYGFTEYYTELKSIKGIKNGSAEVREGAKIIATGNYKNNEKFGRWRYFRNDSLEQLYNYNTHKIEYEKRDPEVNYQIDSLKDGDKLVYPSKIGGNYYGLRFLGPIYNFPSQIRTYKGEYPIYFIFNLDNMGNVVKFNIKTIDGKSEYIQNVDISKLKYENLNFMPAKVNGTAVNSVLIVKSNFKIESKISMSQF